MRQSAIPIAIGTAGNIIPRQARDNTDKKCKLFLFSKFNYVEDINDNADDEHPNISC
jgi:hypothetical protein